MKVVRLKPLLLAIFIIIIFCPYVLSCIDFVLFCFLFFFRGGGGGQRKHVLHKRFDRTITVAFHVVGLFCFCFFFSFSIFPSFLRCNTEVALRLLKLPFNPQFKYMTFMYQQHM